MSAICGYVGHGDKSIVEKMAGSISSGRSVQYFVDDGIAIAGLHRDEVNLACNETQDVWTSITGDIFPERVLRGERGRTNGARGLAETWSKWREDSPRRVHGSFMSVVYDTRKKECIIFNDVLGTVPLFYTQLENAVYFATELRPFLVCQEFPKSIERRALNLYFAYGCIPGQGTILKSVWKLPPASIAKISTRGVFERTYWQIGNFRPNRRKSFDEWVDLLYEILYASVQERMQISKPPTGVLLGGPDSSIVAALLHRVSQGRLHAFTATYGDTEFNEVYSEEVARLLEIDWHAVHIEPSEIPDAIVELAKVYDEPVADMIVSPITYVIVKKASSMVSSIFDGTGPGSLFGFPRPKLTPFKKFSDKLPTPLMRAGREGVQVFTQRSNSLSRMLGLISTSTRPAVEREIEDYWRTMRDERLKTILVQETRKKRVDVHGPLLKVVDTSGAIEHVYRQDLGSAMNIAFQPTHGYLASRVRSICSAWQISHASPYLDRLVCEVAFAMPWGVKTPESEGKYILKAMAVRKRLLPHKVAFQAKRGLGSSTSLSHTQMGIWLGRELSAWTRDTVVELFPSVKHLLDKEGVLKLLRMGKPQEVFEVLNFELWHDYYFPS